MTNDKPKWDVYKFLNGHGFAVTPLNLSVAVQAHAAGRAECEAELQAWRKWGPTIPHDEACALLLEYDDDDIPTEKHKCDCHKSRMPK